ncbi:hypothetical protein QFZ79_001994 [Arthrobacter sp. V4I6]|uniref:hypothetical protein n=1 Tax=unclassified Arthrobacter TaxID=235627 RepID=UPI002787CB43|nr:MULTISPECIES: hypothetical protein [unclassified Arthrobacter]MDQ0819702.1 hypothetical protein [Arthrobacter sp. V1I7]MDQ0853883.1 hypothetical protein [Arthrobacter sp. V4I6]
MIRLRRAGVIAALNLLVVAGLAVGATPAHAVTCAPGTPAPTNNYPGTTVLATSFESQTIAAAGFRAPATAGTGTATISDADAHSGKCAAKLHVTTAAGSLANFSTPLPAGSKDVYADGWFNVTAKGVDGNNVPYFRFFTNGTRTLDVYRSNNGIGPLWLRVASPTGTPTYTRLAPSVKLNSWHHLTLHAVANGAATTVEIWFDNKLVFSSGQVAIDVDTFSAVQLGAEHRRQAGDVYIDDVIIKSSKGVAGKPGTFVPVTPARMLDTRSASPVAADSAVSFQVAGVRGIPAKVASVVFNLTVTSPRSAGFITAYASGTGRPNASNLNFAPGQTVPNLVTVPVGTDGKVTLFNRSPGSAQLIADVTGYYITGTPAIPGSFRSLAPSRILDTRNASPVGADSAVSFQVAGARGIPASVASVVFNLTVTEARSFGFITAYASGTGRPNASNLNFAANQTVPNLVTVPVGADGKVTLFNRSGGTAQLIADVAGYYLPGTPTEPGAFKAIGPTRALDTRNASPAAADAAVAFRVAGANGIPASVSAVVFNLTVTAPRSFGFVTAYASGTARPNASNLNFATGQTVPNLVAVPVGSDGRVSLFNRSSGTSQLIADIAGYFLR